MKSIPFLLAAPLLLSSCIAPAPGPPGLPPPPVPGVVNRNAEDEAFRQGFGFGNRDDRLGRQSNYMLYNNYYNASTKNAFARGYMSGYRQGSR